jgi:NAD(P)-dependent dehydrogenase (short-subunit alcohol dehydrogenase family)
MYLDALSLASFGKATVDEAHGPADRQVTDEWPHSRQECRVFPAPDYQDRDEVITIRNGGESRPDASRAPALGTLTELRILMSRLQGKVAVITGGSSGIGLATAQRFVQEGAHVFITGRRQGELDKAVKLIGRNVTAVQGDVTATADLDRLYARVASEKGKFDILVANAGFIEPQTLEKATEQNFDKTFGINLRGLVFTVHKGLPLLNRNASIVVISSIAGTKGIPGYGTYSATKAAVRSFVRTWAAEFGSSGIRVNAISPGPVDTPIIDTQADTKEAVDQIKASFAQAVPIGRLGRPEEVASAALFLASSESSFVVGVDLAVDGGMAQV